MDFLQDLEGILPSAKVLRLSSTDSQGESTSLMFGGGASTSGTSAAATSETSSSVPVLREPLKKALTSLFQVINHLLYQFYFLAKLHSTTYESELFFSYTSRISVN